MKNHLVYAVFAILLANKGANGAVHFDHEASVVGLTEENTHNEPPGINPINGLPVAGGDGRNPINGLPVGPKKTEVASKKPVRVHPHLKSAPLVPKTRPTTDTQQSSEPPSITEPTAFTMTGPTEVVHGGKTYLYGSHFF